MRIVIIDDDQDFCTVFQRILQKAAHEVYIAFGLKDGFELIEAIRPDVVFLDNYLPDGEGWAWAKKIRIDFPNTHINLISAENKSFFNMQDFENPIWEKPITVQQIETYFKFLKPGNTQDSVTHY